MGTRLSLFSTAMAACLALPSGALGQVTISIASATFSSNPGNLTNTGTPSGFANSTHSVTETSSYALGDSVRINSAELTSVAATTWAEDASFRLENSSYPGLSTYFHVGTGTTFSTQVVTSGAYRLIKASSPGAWGVAPTLLEGTGVSSGSTWLIEAFDKDDDDTSLPDALGADIEFVISPDYDALDPILFNNGTIVNAANQGFGGDHASAITTGGLFGYQSILPYSVADDFTVPPGDGWDVTCVSGYGYLQGTYGSPPVSPISGVTMKIWNGSPAASGTVIATSTVLRESRWTGIYRVTDTTLTNAGRPVFTADAHFPSLRLVPGQYWVTYTLLGAQFTPNLMVPGSPTFAPANGNALHLNGNVASQAMYSTTQTAMPLTVYGRPARNNITGNLVLQDTVGTFAHNRNIGWQLKVGTTTLGSGVITATASPQPFSLTIIPRTGAAELILNGSSFLRRVRNINLTGSHQGIGLVTMRNGDVDNSGEVDAADIDEVISAFGATNNRPEDVDVSGEVDAADIDIVIGSFGDVDD